MTPKILVKWSGMRANERLALIRVENLVTKEYTRFVQDRPVRSPRNEDITPGGFWVWNAKRFTYLGDVLTHKPHPEQMGMWYVVRHF